MRKKIQALFWLAMIKEKNSKPPPGKKSQESSSEFFFFFKKPFWWKQKLKRLPQGKNKVISNIFSAPPRSLMADP